MDDVLHLVLAAHGGLGRWLDVSALTAHLSVGGPFPVAKGWPDMLIEETVEASARREHIVFTPLSRRRSAIGLRGRPRDGDDRAHRRRRYQPPHESARLVRRLRYTTTRWDAA